VLRLAHRDRLARMGSTVQVYADSPVPERAAADA
jgi:hypothetical protein